ncbi:hypothetical protein BS50DRAFT_569602 [Corynespora cassiicola Philippines]|uniref:Uncharacterized protein n=1 Tax=Corynespora cassiicola Philippines TaxID=1448308 RepID=A0A2T2P2X6_CORCC|nr:hypothetical protein BS50DRAFT_569602 [Corynespora cassiicola Philippines]
MHARIVPKSALACHTTTPPRRPPHHPPALSRTNVDELCLLLGSLATISAGGPDGRPTGQPAWLRGRNAGPGVVVGGLAFG